MIIKISKFGIFAFLLISTSHLNAQKNIKIQKVKDAIVYVYDGFESNSLKEDSGIGWNGVWEFKKGENISFNEKSLKYDSKSYNTKGGSVESKSKESSIIERAFKDKYNLKGSTFYTSFLITKDNNASFSLNGFADKAFRYGLKIDKNGIITIRNSGKWGKPSKKGLLKSNKTYLVVLYKRGVLYRSVIFEEGDKIPKNSRKINWITEDKSASGVNLDKIQFEFSGGNVSIDEFRLGATFNSVTETSN